MPAAMRDAFIDAARKAAADTRAHGLAVEKEALAQLKDRGVTVLDCDREAFRKRVLPQSETFIKAHPDAKPVVDLIRATSA
jgi:TRAP-type C4-dicarboxylate transport system substrate-binding protein